MTRILVLGDLNVDFMVQFGAGGGAVSGLRRPGGTALNAARAFRSVGLEPLVIGGIGNDSDGEYLRSSLALEQVPSRLVSLRRPTGAFVNVQTDEQQPRRFSNATDSANRVSGQDLANALLAVASPDVLVFIASHVLVRLPLDECVLLFRTLRAVTRRLVVDLIPHNVGELVSSDFVEQCIAEVAFLLVAELRTIRQLYRLPFTAADTPSRGDWSTAFERLRARNVALRYGGSNIEYQSVASVVDGEIVKRQIALPTGFSGVSSADRVGFGDRLTAKLVRELI